jgi:hypothetical protein
MEWVDITIRGHCSKAERVLLERPVSEWTFQQVANSSWRAESLAVMLWVGRLRDALAPYDVEHDAQALLGLEPVVRDVGSFVRRFSLRPAKDTNRARDTAELWHWRAGIQILVEEGFSHVGTPSLTEIIKITAEAAHERGDSARPMGGDFPVFGKAYGEMTYEERVKAGAIALERHRALHWLCGYERDWDKVLKDIVDLPEGLIAPTLNL